MKRKTTEELKSILKRNPRDFDDKCHLFMDCPSEEYKMLALLALETLCKDQSINFERCRGDYFGWAAHHITKAIFEEQSIFDPYGDKQFIDAAAALCPWYINRYVNDI